MKIKAKCTDVEHERGESLQIVVTSDALTGCNVTLPEEVIWHED